MSTAQAPTNDFWGTIQGVARDYFSYRAARTTAAPSGQVDGNRANPFPGTQGAFPQAEAKPAPGGVGIGFSFANMGSWLVVAVVALIVLALVRR